MVQAAITQEQLVVTISPIEADQISFELQTVGTRYAQAFGSIALCGNFNFDGKISVAPLEDHEEDPTGDVTIVAGKPTTDAPKLVPRLDDDGDLRLFVSRSFFYDLTPGQESIFAVEVGTEDVLSSATPELVARLIPARGIRLQRLLAKKA
jgi:hypothetical protein